MTCAASETVPANSFYRGDQRLADDTCDRTETDRESIAPTRLPHPDGWDD